VSKDAFAADEMAQRELPRGHSVPPMLIRPLLLIASVVAVMTFAGTASAAQPAAPKRVAFTLRYTYSADHFTSLQADAHVTATVKRPHQRIQATTLKALIGVKLPLGTKITVRRGAAKLKLTITAAGVR
jgi:hypothetical protein